MKVTLKLNPVDRIMLARSLGKDGKAQKFFTHEVRRHCDPYVPMLNGPLKNTAVEKTSSIEYVQPYARRNYYENKGNGIRGKKWEKRMWADRGKIITDSVARYIGGRT